MQASVSHMDMLSPTLHCGSCLKGAGAGQGCGGSPCGKEAPTSAGAGAGGGMEGTEGLGQQGQLCW